VPPSPPLCLLKLDQFDRAQTTIDLFVHLALSGGKGEFTSLHLAGGEHPGFRFDIAVADQQHFSLLVLDDNRAAFRRTIMKPPPKLL
jgi:hypothetical protein